MREGDDNVEAISIEIFLKSLKIRCCAAYGPQESDKIERKNKFWEYLHEEVSIAKNSGSGLVLHFDGNLWAGDSIIPGDKRPQNRNGKLFQEFLENNPNLSVVNALPICEGVITRKRNKGNIIEESTLDFFVVCDRILPHVTRMVIDSDKNHTLTNFKPARNGGKAVDSDHMTEYMDLNIKIENEKPVRHEIFNFKNKEAREKFKVLTTETKAFTSCFEGFNEDVLTQITEWREVLKKYCGKAFKKIRIKKRKIKPINAKIVELISKKNELSRKTDQKNIKEKISEIDKKIAEIEAFQNRSKIIENFKCLSDNPESVNLQEMWKKQKKLFPKWGNNLPTAKKNHKGKLVSNPRAIKLLLAREYKDRLRRRPVRYDFADMRKRRDEILKLKLFLASHQKSRDWTIAELDEVLKNLKNKKSPDCEGYINEIFKQESIGENLKQSLLIMFNKLNQKQLIPEFMNICNITTVQKKDTKQI